jgi:uncharacterized protein
MKKIDKILFYSLICFILIIVDYTNLTVFAQPQIFSPTGIEGIWEGNLKVFGTELRIVCKISKNSDDTLTATLDSPDQGVAGIPVEKVMVKDNTLYMEVNSVGGIFEGKISSDFLTIEGQWRQSGQSLPLTVKRVNTAIEILRPQEPKKPYPYL